MGASRTASLHGRHPFEGPRFRLSGAGWAGWSFFRDPATGKIIREEVVALLGLQ